MNAVSLALDSCVQTASIAGPIATAAGVLVALVALLIARWYYVRTLIGKLHDRLLELNKLGVQHPKIAALYFAESSRSKPYFVLPEAERTESYYAVRSYVLFRLNVYEEAFFATQGLFASSTEDGRAWQRYIRQGLAHPLVAEMFEAETGQFGLQFVRFIRTGELPNGDTYRTM